LVRRHLSFEALGLAKENLPRGDHSQSESLEPEDCCPRKIRTPVQNTVPVSYVRCDTQDEINLRNMINLYIAKLVATAIALRNLAKLGTS
jgi:hypothetical protein